MNANPADDDPNNSGPSDTQDEAIVDEASPSVKLEKGPKINQVLAERIDENWQKYFNYNKEEVIMPANLERIKAPALNQEIWDNIPRQARNNDKANLKLQQMLQAVAITTANNADIFVKHLRQNREDQVCKEALSSSLNAISMLGTVSHSIGKTRRSRLKNVLNSSINNICDLRYDADTSQGRRSDNLFGDDLNETMSRGEKHKKLAMSISKPNYTYSYPNSRSSQGQLDFRRGRYSNNRNRNQRRSHGGPRFGRYQKRGR